jgi:hypothetical protein
MIFDQNLTPPRVPVTEAFRPKLIMLSHLFDFTAVKKQLIQNP